jgi:hypothetical protein
LSASPFGAKQSAHFAAIGIRLPTLGFDLIGIGGFSVKGAVPLANILM